MLVLVRDQHQPTVSEVVSAVNFDVFSDLFAVVVVVYRLDKAADNETSGKILESFHRDDVDVHHVVLTLLTTRPVNHSREDISGSNRLSAADMLVLVVVVVTVIVTVTDKQVMNTLLHLSALELALLAVRAFKFMNSCLQIVSELFGVYMMRFFQPLPQPLNMFLQLDNAGDVHP